MKSVISDLGCQLFPAESLRERDSRAHAAQSTGATVMRQYTHGSNPKESLRWTQRASDCGLS